MKISILIPCFNEQNTILKVIKKVNEVNIFGFEKEIIAIDDKSSDKTLEILEQLLKENGIQKLIRNHLNFGKGYSIRKGIEISTGEIILIQDADLEYDPSDYERLIEPIKNGYADVVYGSRFLGGSKVRVLYFWHSLGNYYLTLLSNIFTNLNLTDMEVGYKVFKSKILKYIKLNENRFGFEPEITAKLSKIRDLRIYEISVNYYGRKYSEGKKITWKDGFSALRCILKYNLFK
jgi:glycosyltransferase involved in cell wall biosynthesis